MRVEQIEAWVLSLIDQVAGGAKIEDSRVELKADWPIPRNAARRIAGHANASGGQAILWVIGLDETKGIAKVSPTDLATWRSQLAAEFEGVEPSVTDLVIPTPQGPLTALLFDTSRRPYVVKNPLFGTNGGGSISFEVPWRSGTAIRSARRDELIRLLVPLESSPHVEILSANVTSRFQEAISDKPVFHAIRKQQHIAWHIRFSLYITPRTSELLAIPVHKVLAALDDGTPSTPISATGIHSIDFPTTGWATTNGIVEDSQTISRTLTEALIRGPGNLSIQANCYEPLRQLPTGQPLRVALTITPAGQDRPLEIDLPLSFRTSTGIYDRYWRSEVDLDDAN